MNEPLGLDTGLVRLAGRVNPSRIIQRAGDFAPRRKLAGEAQQNAHEIAIRCMDLTTLSGGDTAEDVQRLCARALAPLPHEYLRALELESLTVGAFCGYHQQVPIAVEALGGRIPVAAVSTSFSDGQGPLETREREVVLSIEAGATEIDVVIRRELALRRDWKEMYREITRFRQACGNRAKLKVILGVGDLEEMSVIAMAAMVAIMAGADTIKTSTGKEKKFNATLPVGLVMVRTIRMAMDEINENMRVGFKPAGGLSSAKVVQAWISMMFEELGLEWLTPALFRIGASSLLDDLVLQVGHFLTERYGALHHVAM